MHTTPSGLTGTPVLNSCELCTAQAVACIADARPGLDVRGSEVVLRRRRLGLIMRSQEI